MCIFCNQPVHTPARRPPPGSTFKDLRLSEQDYAKAIAKRETSMGDRLAEGPNAQTIRVYGSSGDVKDLLKEASGVDSQDWVEIPFSMMESVLWIMQRLERVVRVPMQYWVLSGDGVIYSPGHLVMTLSHFKQGGTISITMIPIWEVEDFAQENLKTHTWKHLSPSPPATLPADLRERAQVLFNLMDPIESPYWKEYIKHRQAAEKITEEMMEGMAGSDMDPYMENIREAIDEVLIDIDTELDDEDSGWEKIADGISIAKCDVEDDGDEIRDADVISRIHSPNSPHSVDVHFFYHSRTGYSYIERLYNIGFRINLKPVKPVSNLTSNDDVDRAHRTNGWKPFGWYYLDDRRADHSACPVKKADLKAVHKALFGSGDGVTENGSESLLDKIDLRATAKLMLASVGLQWEIALDEEMKEDQGDGYMLSYGDRAFLEIDSEKPGISSAHLRKICGIPALKDDDTADLSREQVGEAMDPDSDELDDDDNDYRDFDETDDDDYDY